MTEPLHFHNRFCLFQGGQVGAPSYPKRWQGGPWFLFLLQSSLRGQLELVLFSWAMPVALIALSRSTTDVPLKPWTERWNLGLGPRNWRWGCPDWRHKYRKAFHHKKNMPLNNGLFLIEVSGGVEIRTTKHKIPSASFFAVGEECRIRFPNRPVTREAN